MNTNKNPMPQCDKTAVIQSVIMIKANELREGNFILGNYEVEETEEIKTTICKFLGNRFQDNYFDVESEDYIEEFIDFEPILLTEEWLLKFGFVKDKLSYNLEKLAISIKGVQYDNGRTYFNSWAILEHQPMYVHQLQNLYFALTQSELTVV